MLKYRRRWGSELCSYIHTAVRRVRSIGTCAAGNGVDQCVLVCPAVDKIGVETVSCGVAHGVDPAVEVGEGRGVVEELVEDGIDGLWVRLGAYTTVVGSDCGKGHLRRKNG